MMQEYLNVIVITCFSRDEEQRLFFFNTADIFYSVLQQMDSTVINLNVIELLYLLENGLLSLLMC